MATLRRRRAGTARRGGGVAAGARSGLWILARIVSLVTAIVVGIIVVGILLVVFKANRDNDIVSTINDAAKTLVGPFKDVFSLKGTRRTVVNWGLAAVVYAIVGGLIARLLRR